MSALPKFDWDDANRSHLSRHAVTPEEFEQMFEYRRLESAQQRKGENRMWCLGRTASGRVLDAVYTLRNGRIRAVTAHTANRKLRRLYAETVEAEEQQN